MNFGEYYDPLARACVYAAAKESNAVCARKSPTRVCLSLQKRGVKKETFHWILPTLFLLYIYARLLSRVCVL